MQVQGERLWNRLMALAQIGATAKGGVCRLALTDLDRQARDLVVQWARELGCTIRIDAIGNIFMRREGRLPGPAVATGSHIDTQPTGGKFDGNYGVLAGLEVIHTLNDHSMTTELPLEVCVWTNEEGSRFVPVMMGSGVWAGAFSLDSVLQARDRDGISVSDALHHIGYAGSAPACVHDGADRFAAYFEAHIEQGPVLEHANLPIGVVSGALGQRWYDVVVSGQEAHAGPTPMALRRDALQAALPLMHAIRAIALADQPNARGTVGYVRVEPNSRNTIPGKVTFTVDFRNTTESALQRMEVALHEAIALAHAKEGCTITLVPTVSFAPAPFDPTLRQLIREGANAHGLAAMELTSGAGHDAVYCARHCPTAMIFVPCTDGISHNEVEDAKPHHLTAGANVLLHAMLARAGRAVA